MTDLIEFYKSYAANLPNPDERHIILETIEVLKTTDTPEGLIGKIMAAVPYDKSIVRRVLRVAAKHKRAAYAR